MQRIGVDAVSVERIELAVKRSGTGFLTRVYTPAVLAYCAGSAERLAGRWAAKEAVIKCFDGTGICFPRKRIEVLPGPLGAPRVRLLGDARGARVEVSITHHSGLAVATSHLEMPEETMADLLPAPDAVVLPARPKDAHKGTFGTVVVIAGSLGLTGAAYLASTAAARTGAGLKGAKEWGAVIVLKGAKTVVAHPDGRWSEDPHEVPALATGGTGDVLAGVIGALVAQGLDAFTAAVTGVYIHAAAGRRVAQKLGDSGLLAGDL